MTPIQLLKILRKCFICLLVWNLLITGFLFTRYNSNQEESLNKQICNLEAIPDTVPEFELIEVE